MTRVLRDNKVIVGVAKNKLDAAIEYMVAKMELILTAPEEVIIKEGDTIDSNILLFKFI